MVEKKGQVTNMSLFIGRHTNMIDRNWKIFGVYSVVFGFLVLSIGGCRVNPIRSRAVPLAASAPETTSACTPSSKPEFAYILDGRKVSMFSVDSCSGIFTPTMPNLVPTGSRDSESNSEVMTTDLRGRFAYVANPGTDESSQSNVSMYTINRNTGVLTPTSPATVPTGWYPQEIVVDPLGRFAYTANTYGHSISMFTINQVTGVLTPTKPASVSTILPGHLKSAVVSLAIDPTGRFLYVPITFTPGAAISMFAINQLTGMLNPISEPTFLSAGVNLFDVKVTPNGRFLYVVHNDSSGQSAKAVWEYSIDPSTGRLSQIVAPLTPMVATGSGSTAITIDPTSRYAYVVNRAGNSISMFAINPKTGALAPNMSSKAPLGVFSEMGAPVPFRIMFDPAGKFVYVTNQEGPIAIYTLATDGTLVNAGTTGPASGALSTAIVSPQ